MARKPREAICAECGKAFEYIDAHRKYCSRACFGAAHKRTADEKYEERICPVCGKPFKTASAYRKQVCCSPACAAAQRPAKKKLNPPKPNIDITGEEINGNTAVRFLGKSCWEWRCSCGKLFTAKAADIRSGEVKSCGHLLSERAARVGAEQAAALQSAALKNIMAGKLRRTNTSGVTGVHIVQNVASIVYVASITVKGERLYLGRFASLESAALARKIAERKYFSRRILPDKDDEE